MTARERQDGRLLEGKVAIVTGGNRGIGRAIATAFAAAGASVVLAARNRAELAEVENFIQSQNGKVLAIPTDVSKPESVTAMIEETGRKFGTVDILVNNSGIAGPTASIENTAIAQWEETLAINLTGPFLCSRAVIAQMRSKGEGRIINISSVTGKRPLPDRVPYAASKLGLIGLTRTLAAEVGKYNITVNAISPGATEGERINGVIERMAHTQNKTVKEVQASLTEGAALKRFVDAEDIASMAVFLASRLGRNITGQDINVCAGLAMY